MALVLETSIATPAILITQPEVEPGHAKLITHFAALRMEDLEAWKPENWIVLLPHKQRQESSLRGLSLKGQCASSTPKPNTIDIAPNRLVFAHLKCNPFCLRLITKIRSM